MTARVSLLPSSRDTHLTESFAILKERLKNSVVVSTVAWKEHRLLFYPRLLFLSATSFFIRDFFFFIRDFFFLSATSFFCPRLLFFIRDFFFPQLSFYQSATSVLRVLRLRAHLH